MPRMKVDTCHIISFARRQASSVNRGSIVVRPVIMSRAHPIQMVVSTSPPNDDGYDTILSIWKEDFVLSSQAINLPLTVSFSNKVLVMRSAHRSILSCFLKRLFLEFPTSLEAIKKSSPSSVNADKRNLSLLTARMLFFCCATLKTTCGCHFGTSLLT